MPKKHSGKTTLYFLSMLICILQRKNKGGAIKNLHGPSSKSVLDTIEDKLKSFQTFITFCRVMGLAGFFPPHYMKRTNKLNYNRRAEKVTWKLTETIMKRKSTNKEKKTKNVSRDLKTVLESSDIFMSINLFSKIFYLRRFPVINCF